MMQRVDLRIAAVFALAWADAATASTEVTLRPSVVVNDAIVRLSDVAVVSAGESDDELGRRLESLPLMPAPAPGTQRFLRKREVEDLLSAHSIDLSELRLSGADLVSLSAPDDGWTRSAPARGSDAKLLNRHAALLAGQTASDGGPVTAPRVAELHGTLSRTIIEYLKAKSDLAAEWRVTCELPERQLVLLDAATPSPICQGGTPPWTGRQRFLICAETPEGTFQLPVYAQVTAVSAPLVVAARPIARKAVITAADLELRSVDYLPRTTDRRSPVDSIETLIGMEARHAIQPGNVVYTDQVQAPILIKRGELVTVASHAGGIRVRTTARARQDGAPGELVQLESLETRERFDARVTGLREAAVFAAARMAKDNPERPLETVRR